MTNFSNLTNFVNSFLRNPMVRTTSNIAAGEIGAPLTPGKSVLSQSSTFLKTNKVTLDTSLVIAQMTAKERAIIVKEFLELPSDLNELLQSVNSQSQQASSQLQKNVNVIASLDLAALMALLQTNGKAAQEKLFQLISFLKQQGDVDTKQFQELQSIINACIPLPGTNQAQFLKNLILLYLPWLPVGEQNNFDIEFTKNDEDKSGGELDDTVTILIKTKNFGNVKVVLTLVNAHKLDMQVNCSKEFPKERLEELLQRDFSDYSLDTSMEFLQQDVSNTDESPNETKIHMNTSPKLSPYLLLAAHSVIRSVVEIDKSCSLVVDRKEKLK